MFLEKCIIILWVLPVSQIAPLNHRHETSKIAIWLNQEKNGTVYDKQLYASLYRNAVQK